MSVEELMRKDVSSIFFDNQDFLTIQYFLTIKNFMFVIVEFQKMLQIFTKMATISSLQKAVYKLTVNKSA